MPPPVVDETGFPWITIDGQQGLNPAFDRSENGGVVPGMATVDAVAVPAYGKHADPCGTPSTAITMIVGRLLAVSVLGIPRNPAPERRQR